LEGSPSQTKERNKRLEAPLVTKGYARIEGDVVGLPGLKGATGGAKKVFLLVIHIIKTSLRYDRGEVLST